MCGIAFFINYSTGIGRDKLLDLGMVKEMFIKLEERGTDASGIYFERATSNGIIRRIVRSPMKASELWDATQTGKDKRLGDCILNGKEQVVMLHTRHTTVGSEFVHENNHPIYSNNYVLVHNGTVIATPKVDGYKYNGDVDSEKILAQVETNGHVDGINLCVGSMAVMFKRLNGKWLYLYRNSNPMHLMYIKDQSLLIGASRDTYFSMDDKEALTNMFAPKAVSMELPYNSLWKVSTVRRSVSCVKTYGINSEDAIDKYTGYPHGWQY